MAQKLSDDTLRVDSISTQILILASRIGKKLVIFSDHNWASARLHWFVVRWIGELSVTTCWLSHHLEPSYTLRGSPCHSSTRYYCSSIAVHVVYCCCCCCCCCYYCTVMATSKKVLTANIHAPLQNDQTNEQICEKRNALEISYTTSSHSYPRSPLYLSYLIGEAA